jgi:4-hydroxybenzoate polyprenyltransferase
MPYRILTDTKILFKLSRPLNLGIAALVLIESFWLTAGKTFVPFNESLTWLLILLTILVMAAGYWINDLFDYRIDLINKPTRTYIPAKISAKKVWTAWFATWIFVSILAALFPVRIQLILQGCWVLLFLYARYFKRKPAIGNLVVASLGAALVLTASAWLYSLSFTVLCLAIFSFEATLIREIAKDIEDLKGDLKFHLSTLPILIGLNATRNLLAWVYAVFLASCLIPIVVDYWIFHKVNLPFIFFLLALVIAPCIRLIFLLGRATKPEDYGKMSSLLKALMLGGMIALAFL